MKPNSKPYFEVETPFHFRLRPDLAEELCVRDAIEQSLPQTPAQHAHWLRVCGLSEAEAPLAKIQRWQAPSDPSTSRFVFESVVLPGRLDYTNVVTDETLAVGPLEYHRLVDFVFARAVEYAVWRGMSAAVANGCLRPRRLAAPAAQRTVPLWAIGYHSGSGLSVVLVADDPDSIRCFLAGEPDYRTAF